MKQLITAQDISEAKKQGKSRLSLPADAIITPQAQDDARACGISFAEAPPVREAQPSAPCPCAATAGQACAPPSGQTPSQTPGCRSDADALAAEVRRRVVARLAPFADTEAITKAVGAVLSEKKLTPATAGTLKAPVTFSGAALVRAADILPAGAGKASSGVTGITEALTPDGHGPGIGYLAFADSSFAWTFAHNEVLVVLEGELSLEGNGATLRAGPGDALRIDAGAEFTLSAAGPLRCVYSAWPQKRGS